MENAQKRYTASSAPLKKSNDYLESKVEIFFFFSFLSKNSCKRYIITATTGTPRNIPITPK
jgi:hypothetical protein